jgi:hypothetical protein
MLDDPINLALIACFSRSSFGSFTEAELAAVDITDCALAEVASREETDASLSRIGDWELASRAKLLPFS